MIKIFISFFLTTFFLLLSIHQTSAKTTYFFDDFEDGNANQWIRTNGPSLWQVQNGKYGARINSNSTIIETAAGSIPTSKYIIEFDMSPSAGEDKNIYFRGRNNHANYGIHFNNSIYYGAPGAMFSKAGSNQTDWPKRAPYLFDNSPRHVKIILDEQHIQFFLNDTKIFDEIDPDYQFTTNEQVILIITTGGNAPTEVWFDNVRVTSLDNDETLLDVPVLKQTDPNWGWHVYDTANIWSPLSPTINDWGCAMTSAAMVLKYHGYKKLPDGTALDPGTLNTWLKNQADGYVGGGLVNWLALTRLSKLAKTINEITKFDALEFFRVKGEEKAILKMDLENSIPDILEEPGHFIVAKGISEDTFVINDPYFDRSTLNEGYSNTFLSMQTFIPSSTDLSYFMFLTDESTEITLTDESDNETGEQFIQQPLQNELTQTFSGAPVKYLYLKKPENGIYKVKLSSSKLKHYNIEIFLYDNIGNYSKILHSGIIGPKNDDFIVIDFDKISSDNSVSKRTVTFQSTIKDINLLKKLILIKNNTIANLLGGTVKIAQKEYKLKQYKLALLTLNTFEKIINQRRGKEIDEKAYQILLTDVLSLKNLVK